MSYANQFLRDFSPVFTAILKAVRLKPESVELEIIDEEDGSYSVFEPVDVRDVLEQFSDRLNYLTIFTDRPEYFKQFAETMYEENGLIVGLFSKAELKKTEYGRTFKRERKVMLDFEWEGACYKSLIGPERYYIPIHKKKWVRAEIEEGAIEYASKRSAEKEAGILPGTMSKMRENLDIIVPIGYNTMTIKSIPDKKKKPDWDRFEAAFYEEYD